MRNERGFTLIEVLVVVLLLALAAGLAVLALGHAGRNAQAKSVGALPSFFRQVQTQAMAADQNCSGVLLADLGKAGDPWLVTFSAQNESCSSVGPSDETGLEATCGGGPPPSGFRASCISLPAGTPASPDASLPSGWSLGPLTPTTYDPQTNKYTAQSPQNGPLLVTFNNDGSLNAAGLPGNTASFTFAVSTPAANSSVSFLVYTTTGLITRQ